MTIALYPVAADATHVRVWLGVTGHSAPPMASWTFGPSDIVGVATTPSTVRALAPVRGAIPPTAGAAKTYSGLFEFVVPESGLARPAYRVAVTVGSERVELVTKALPASFELNETVRVLMVSCYCRDEDRGGALGQTARFVAQKFRPDVSLLMGDQVYLDIPTLANLPERGPQLLDVLESNYVKNWLPDPLRQFTFADVLRAAPFISLPDDHEYWNNAPHASPMVQNSWTNAGRNTWRSLADQLFDAFQDGSGVSKCPHRTIDLGPVSLFAANGRTHRQADLTRGFHDTTPHEVDAWANAFSTGDRFPLFLTGQSMLDKPTGKVSGAVADYVPSNYLDYRPVMERLDRLAREAVDVLLLTGDVHWGRVAELVPSAVSAARLYEVITSPSTLVTFPGIDAIKKLRGWFSRDPWPRHDDAPKLDERLAIDRLNWTTTTLFPHKGDQLCVLELTRAPDGLDVVPNYVEVGTMNVRTAPRFRLRRRTP